MRDKIFDRLRRRYVADAPEERIRQAIVEWMLDEGGYSPSLICIEQQLMRLEGAPPSAYPLGDLARAPLRRFDLLCVHLNEGRLKPLLLVECKAARISERAKKQVLDYNYHVGAPFIALACDRECAFASFETAARGAPIWHRGLPTLAGLQKWLLAPPNP